jgi:hypothetical protein
MMLLLTMKYKATRVFLEGRGGSSVRKIYLTCAIKWGEKERNAYATICIRKK